MERKPVDPSLRLSSHSLEVERGRYTNAHKEQKERFCAFCKQRGTDKVEDEKHFLLSCPMSKELREKFLPKHILNNSRLNDDEKFTKIILSDPKNTAKFTFLAFEHRDITLDVLNTLQDMMGNVETLLREQNFNKEDNIEYVVKDVSNNGMKLTLSNAFSAYSVKNTSKNGMKLTLLKV